MTLLLALETCSPPASPLLVSPSPAAFPRGVHICLTLSCETPRNQNQTHTPPGRCFPRDVFTAFQCGSIKPNEAPSVCSSTDAHVQLPKQQLRLTELTQEDPDSTLSCCSATHQIVYLVQLANNPNGIFPSTPWWSEFRSEDINYVSSTSCFQSQWFHRVTSHQDSLGDLVRVGAELQLFLPLLVWSSD